MSAEQKIETARQMYQAFGRGDVQAILDLVTDDVDWSTDAAIVQITDHIGDSSAQALLAGLASPPVPWRASHR